VPDGEAVEPIVEPEPGASCGEPEEEEEPSVVGETLTAGLCSGGLNGVSRS
jgi:hypothetical protein